MRVKRLVLAVGIGLFVSVHAAVAEPAEPAMTPLEIAVGCAPPTSFDASEHPLRIVGAQDTEARSIYAPGEMLVVNGGTRDSVQLGQQYYIRRPMTFGAYRSSPNGVQTVGWLRIVAVNDTTAIGALDRVCSEVAEGDYLEPYTAPTVPADADSDQATGDLDFSSLGRVMFGSDSSDAGGRGSLMLIDRGADEGMKAGGRFAIYRDVRASGLPLASIGEGVVISAGKKMALVRITESRDAVVAGDYVVPRK